jgi:hypothetical protein
VTTLHLQVQGSKKALERNSEKERQLPKSSKKMHSAKNKRRHYRSLIFLPWGRDQEP